MALRRIDLEFWNSRTSAETTLGTSRFLRNLMFESLIARQIIPRRNHIQNLCLGNELTHTELHDDVSKENTTLTPSSPNNEPELGFHLEDY